MNSALRSFSPKLLFITPPFLLRSDILLFFLTLFYQQCIFNHLNFLETFSFIFWHVTIVFFHSKYILFWISLFSMNYLDLLKFIGSFKLTDLLLHQHWFLDSQKLHKYLKTSELRIKKMKYFELRLELVKTLLLFPVLLNYCLIQSLTKFLPETWSKERFFS